MENNCNKEVDIDLGDSDKPSMARFRWKILSKALHPKSTTTEEDLSPELGSVRRFGSFGLILLKDMKTFDSNEDLRGNWFECRVRSSDEIVVEIRLLTQKIPIYELLNCVDNTGNVCLWPSEEVLTYYCHQNRDLFENKIVLELGGGMTSLSGLMTGVFSCAKRVILTDANQRCLTNIRTIIDRNRRRLKSNVDCRRLKWGEDSDFSDLYHRIDIILCSDCLYFTESHHLLVETIEKLLKRSGFGILLAPTRGHTFHSFVEFAKTIFDLKIIENYDQSVYELHKHFIKTSDISHYIPDLHYPLMIHLKHKSNNQSLI